MGSRRIGRKRIKSLSSRGVTDTITAGVNAPSVTRQTTMRVGNKIITEISVDLGGGNSEESTGTVDQIIAKASATSACQIAVISLATHGHITFAEIACLEAPTTGCPDIDLVFGTNATDAQGAAVTGASKAVETGGDLDLGARVGSSAGIRNFDSDADVNLYLVTGKGSAAGAYDAGKLLITLEGIASDAVPDHG